ncbi:Metallo-dependent phosphatase-like protein, partial [Obelidium mucronatum]
DALIIGDWGNFGNLDNQKAVAAVMDTWAGVQQSQVVLSLGDNFYSTPNSSYNYEGVKSADDKKFKDLWSNVYSGTSLKSLPWWMVLGNHDWYLNKSQIYELEYSHPNWQLPDFFYTKRVEVADNTWASFIFIETDLLNYGYSGKSGWDMGNNFKSHDWVPAQKTVEKQLAWLDNALAKANNDAYVFILGHHTGFACGADVTGSKFMQNVTNLVNKWDASAYINGHHHTLAYYNTNGGKTLQVQVGSGGNLDGTCPPLTNATGQEAAEYGFAHLRLTKSAASFDF